jgi:hypothetical protein
LSFGEGPPEGLRYGSALRAAGTSSFGEALRRSLATVAAVLIGGGASVFACPMCFGAAETTMVDGTKLGVLVMLVITLAVQGGFVSFFFYLRKCARRNAEVELDTEWSELQKGPRTS